MFVKVERAISKAESVRVLSRKSLAPTNLSNLKNLPQIYMLMTRLRFVVFWYSARLL